MIPRRHEIERGFQMAMFGVAKELSPRVYSKL